MKKPFEPNLRTPDDQICEQEKVKLNSNGLRDNLKAEFRDESKSHIELEAEQLAKSYGIYLEFNRAKTGTEKDWMYLIRVSNPGGGPINRKQWQLLDELSEKYTVDPDGNTSMRFTTRQNIQFHWVSKKGVLDIVKTLAENDLRSINGCGDNTRNVMSCPLSQFSNIFNGNAWAHKTGGYFQLPLAPYIEIFEIDPNYLRTPEQSYPYGKRLLNRKFKIAFSALHKDPQTGKIIPDNCVELLTNDLAIAPIPENGKVNSFQLYVGGGQGERNGKPSLAALAQPLCRIDEQRLLEVMSAVVKVHEDWGDRQNRHWARIKYVIKKMGADWYRDQVSALLGYPLEKPDPNHDYGARHLHHGWQIQPSNGLLAFGAFLENGRVTDVGPNGKLKTMIREIMNKYPVELMITPNQDALFTNIPVAAKNEFENDLAQHGFGKRNGKTFSELRMRSGACVGRDTCRLTYTDSEKFEPFLLDELETMGWGNLKESIGITGCERQCFRPSTKTIGLVGSGLNRYQLRLMGTEDARHQGQPLISGDGQAMYMRSIPREKVPLVLDTLFKFHQAQKNGDESLGHFHRRIGMEAIIRHLKENPATSELMEKPFPTDCVIE